ncbi:hypothetical protein UGMREWDR_CDS0006 [Aeromonas phage GomatiRiver_11]|nr:hypothetical protein OBDJBBDK_00006 [Aeromonas phage AhFM11]WKW84173.1 hypothetical protein UGMREWDR_CDS0006 [Aeromonas phage GomatiRiver_11]
MSVKMKIRFNGQEYDLEAETAEHFAQKLYKLFTPSMVQTAGSKFDIEPAPVFRQTDWTPAVACWGGDRLPFFFKGE